MFKPALQTPDRHRHKHPRITLKHLHRKETEKEEKSRLSTDKHPVICPLASVSQTQGCLLARFVLYTTAKTLKQGAEPRTKVYPPRFHRGKASNPVSALQVSTAGGEERKEEREGRGDKKKKKEAVVGHQRRACSRWCVCNSAPRALTDRSEASHRRRQRSAGSAKPRLPTDSSDISFQQITGCSGGVMQHAGTASSALPTHVGSARFDVETCDLAICQLLEFNRHDA